MKLKLYNIFLCICIAAVLGLSVFFFFRYEPVSIEVPILNNELVQSNQAEITKLTQQRQNTEQLRKRQKLEARMYACQNHADCVIVDKHPCGCLHGPAGVTAINGNFSLEFSKLLDKDFPNTMTCPSVSSVEKECSPSARAVCKESRCQIIY